MLRGINAIVLDSKGRLAIPTRYRTELTDWCGGQLVITVAVNETGAGEHGCLWLYPLPEWEKLEQTLSRLPTLNKMSTRLKRFLIGYACECEMDSQGRFLIPGQLRQFAQLNKKIMMIGQLNKFELWNETAWHDQESNWITGADTDDLKPLEQLSF
ncbi:MAG: division/cell wall cluster transcriptional repressor MraZ [Methylococcales bacterium]|nr:division/cell wall cluster transcriptional repressor MraZ [Methylococcales bacterium]